MTEATKPLTIYGTSSDDVKWSIAEKPAVSVQDAHTIFSHVDRINISPVIPSLVKLFDTHRRNLPWSHFTPPKGYFEQANSLFKQNSTAFSILLENIHDIFGVEARIITAHLPEEETQIARTALMKLADTFEKIDSNIKLIVCSSRGIQKG